MCWSKEIKPTNCMGYVCTLMAGPGMADRIGRKSNGGGDRSGGDARKSRSGVTICVNLNRWILCP